MPTGFVKAGFGMSASEKARILNPIISLTVYDQEGNEIGYITRFEPSSTRRVDRQRHFNAADAGRVVELTYSPEDIQLVIEGFYLYHPGYEGVATGSLIDRLYRAGNTTAEAILSVLNKQAIPFNIVEETIHPATSKGIRKTYLDCLIRDWAGAYQITQAFVSERVTVIVSNIDIEEI